MKKLLLAACALLITVSVFAADAKPEKSKNIALRAPYTKVGKPIMEALDKRQSIRKFSTKEVDLQTLSNLVWAANGVNRNDGKRTAPSAMNRQEIDVYVCLKSGAYFYNPKTHVLEFLTDNDCRLLDAPVTLVLASESGKTAERWMYTDAGIVSQNISLFCSGMGLATVPRGQMPEEQLKKAFKMDARQALLLNHPVGYE